MTAPAARYLSLGARVQSTTLLLLAVQGRIPAFNVAIFADTGWEPAAVYAHLPRLERLAAQPRVPLDQVVLRPQPADGDDVPGYGPWTCPYPGESAHEDDHTPVAREVA